MNWVCSLASKGTLDDCARSELNEIKPTLGKSKALSGLPSFSLMTWRVCAVSVAYSSLAPSSSRSALGAPPANGISPQNLSCSNNLFYSASKCHLQTRCEFCYWQDLILKSNFKIQLSISFHFPKQHTLKKIIIPPQFWSVIAQIGTMQTELISLGRWAIFISLFFSTLNDFNTAERYSSPSFLLSSHQVFNRLAARSKAARRFKDL